MKSVSDKKREPAARGLARSSAKPQAAARRRAAVALGWALTIFVASQAALAVAVERWRPEWRDGEFGYKLVHLRNLLAKHPSKPLVLALGSSRTQLGFRPSAVRDALAADGTDPVVFNFGMVGAGPFLELLTLERLLACGIRPALVVVEVLPPRLNQYAAPEADTFDRNRLGWRDWPLVRCHATPGAPTDYRRWFRAQLTPGFSHRLGLMSYYLPRWVPYPDRQDAWWTCVDRSGWMAYSKELTEESYRHGLEHAWLEYVPLLNRFHVGDVPDRILRELLAVCRRESIRVVLVAMPEEGVFRGWYPATAQAEIEAYFTRLRAETGVAFADARRWVPDGSFADGHHLLPRGADLYSGRLGRDVLRPLLGSGEETTR